DTFRRQSYLEQFAELEQKFDIKTLRAFSEWPQFVEASQRRNLMTHNDGRVSQQYLTVCDRVRYSFEIRPTVNDRLKLTPKYLLGTIFLLNKVAFMLGHTLWRKVLPEDANAADAAMNDTIYRLLERKRWKSAAHFGEFGLQPQLAKQVTDIDRRIRVINTAIALTNLDKQLEAEALLDAEDWSASIREFKLAIAVLKKQYVEAAGIMREIG